VGTAFLTKNPFDEPPGSSKPKKKAGTGATAMRHARAIAAAFWPGQPTIEAQKRIVWLPGNECAACGRSRTPRSMAEDIFGVFDLAVVGFGTRDALVQVTTEVKSRSTVAARKRKIEDWLNQNPVVLDRSGSQLAPYIEVWAWVARTHMRRWRWHRSRWVELAPQRSPLLAKPE